jgi:hypothetical protein
MSANGTWLLSHMVFDLMSCISEGYAFEISVHVVDIATGLSVAYVVNTVKILCAYATPDTPKLRFRRRR